MDIDTEHWNQQKTMSRTVKSLPFIIYEDHDTRGAEDQNS